MTQAQVNEGSARSINDALGGFVSQGHLHIERLLPASVERVWEYLTHKDKCARWLATFESDLTVGSSVKLHFNHGSLNSEEVAATTQNCPMVTGKIVECVPPQKLTYTWGFAEQESEVTFELAEQGDNTLLTVNHKNITDCEHQIAIGAGWHAHLGILLDKLHGVTPRPFSVMHQELQERYSQLVA